MSAKNLPPLPKELEEEMRAFRRSKPSEELCERVFASLPEREPETRPAVDLRPERSSRRNRRFMLNRVVPVLAVATAGAFLLFGREKPTARHEIERSSEQAVALPEDGQAWTELDLQTQHHADQPALVHVTVPTHVRVRLLGEDGQAFERHCEAERCVHRFTHRPNNGSPLRVAVAHPGRYEIHVHHESNKANLRERFVLHANR